MNLVKSQRDKYKKVHSNTIVSKLFLLSMFLFFLASCNAKHEKLKIACAANMQYALDSLVMLFEEQENVTCQITAGSSGMLATQILNGAPYDFFVSADLEYPTAIFESGKGEAPFTYGKGRLILVLTKDASYETLEDALTDVDLKRIGIADPRLAPYGKAASEYLASTELTQLVENRLITGESIGQINQYITTGAVDAAFTSYSFMVENEGRFKFFEVDAQTFTPIEQGALVLNYSGEKKSKAADKFKDFITSEKGKSVLSFFGYLVD
jgi:molybdate transport system substrate-binding protein